MPQTMLYMLNPGTYLLAVLKEKFELLCLNCKKPEGSINQMKMKQSHTKIAETDQAF